MAHPHADTTVMSATGAPMVAGSIWHARRESGGNILEIEDLRIGSTAGREIIKGVSLSLRPAEILALVGESGSGKTTVGLTALGHLRRGLALTGGTVTLCPSNSTEPAEMTSLDDASLRRLRGARVSYIPQDPALSLNPSMRVGEQIREVLDIHRFGTSAEERAERVRSVLREVGLPDDDAYQSRWPHQLSGGQQQRIGIAMAFAMYPDVLVLDEPTTGLDVSTQALVLETIREMTVKNNAAGLYITHDLAVVAEIADRVAVMLSGELVEEGAAEEVLRAPRHTYTKTLIAAVPDLAGRNRISEFEARRRAAAGEEELSTGGFGIVEEGAEAETETGAEAGSAVAGTDSAGSVAAGPAAGASGTGSDSGGATTAAAGASATAEAATGAAEGDAPAEPVVQVRGLTLAYGRKTVLDGIDLDLRAGECTMLLGESGSGKTTLSRSLAGILDTWTGSVAYRGEELAPSTRRRTVDQRREIQYIFQSPFSSLNPRRTLGESISVPLEMSSGLSAAERRERVDTALDAVRLGRAFRDRRPGDLSGGERQRAAIARALVNMPTVLICDEITSALDVSVQASIIDLLSRLREERGLTMLFVTHNIALARHVSARVAVLNQGRIVDEGPTDAVLTSPTHAYTKELLANVPTL
ncbi:ABC transporter ATP-binding protein [Brevibacterium album]|uniref:ABC transporter ATP-binding protein n=1 Tax=Brevibacterium album TaxID=417948 RepID=UPI00146FC076|nr:ABC transporter ATP-binding protein [Brevibacterium album]